MKTRITELFGIEHPVIQGGMHYVGLAEMAAAVSNAGGLGIITGLTQGTPEKLANEIARCREMTDKPFGVNLTFLPSLTPPDYPGLVNTIIESGVKAVETAGNNPAKWLPQLKNNKRINILTKKGAWISFEGNLVGQGREAAKQTLAENYELMAKITAGIMEKVQVTVGSVLAQGNTEEGE